MIQTQHGVRDAVKDRASWRGTAAAELVWLSGVAQRKDNMLGLKDSFVLRLQTERQ